MGGRGGASGFPTNAPTLQAAPQSAGDAKDLNELAQYMKSTHNITVDVQSLSGFDFESVKNGVSAVESIITEFPQAAKSFHKIEGTTNTGGLAWASYSGAIMLAAKYYTDRNKLMSVYAYDVKYGGSPAGTTGDNVLSHESGHLLERALIHKSVTSQIQGPASRLAGVSAWQKHAMATKVIHEAVSNVKKTPAGKGMNTAGLIRQVSSYATTNRSEALAECVADYAANGAGAKPLSVAVWNILKRELG